MKYKSKPFLSATSKSGIQFISSLACCRLVSSVAAYRPRLPPSTTAAVSPGGSGIPWKGICLWTSLWNKNIQQLGNNFISRVARVAFVGGIEKGKVVPQCSYVYCCWRHWSPGRVDRWLINVQLGCTSAWEAQTDRASPGAMQIYAHVDISTCKPTPAPKWRGQWS